MSPPSRHLIPGTALIIPGTALNFTQDGLAANVT